MSQSSSNVAKIKILKESDLGGPIIEHGCVCTIHWRLKNFVNGEVVDESAQDEIGDKYTVDDPLHWTYNLVNQREGNVIKIQQVIDEQRLVRTCIITGVKATLDNLP